MTKPFVTLANNVLSLVLWPDCGGRLISLQVDGTELLWRNPEFFDAAGNLVRPKHTWPPLDDTMGSWSNVGGSKTWPAPQGWTGEGEWPGPPDAVLDSGPWSMQEEPATNTRTITMTSPDDDRTGLRVTRSFQLPNQGYTFTQTNTFRNMSDHPTRWSIWEVCQVDTTDSVQGGALRVTVSDDTPPTRMIEAFGKLPVGTLKGNNRMLPIPEAVGKLGFPNATGAVELTRPDGATLRLQSDPDAQAEYPDGGNRVELWLQCPLDEPLEQFGGLHPRAHLAELEVLSPLQTLQPGQASTLTITWTLTPARS